MSTAAYDLCIAPMRRALTNLDACLSKAEAYAEADEYLEPGTLVQARLYPNMAPLVFQIQVATDTAKGATARLSGNELPSWPDEEETFEDLHQRIAKALGYIDGFSADDFTDAEQRDIQLKLGPYTVDFTASEYIANFVMPNFFFHVTTAYAIMRHSGVEVGKMDFLGEIPGLGD